MGNSGAGVGPDIWIGVAYVDFRQRWNNKY